MCSRQLVAFELGAQGSGVGGQPRTRTVGVARKNLSVGVEAGCRYGKVLSQLEHEELQAVTLSLVQLLFAGAVIPQHDNSDVSAVGISPGVGALVGYRPSLPDPAGAINDIVIADVSPSLLALVVALDSQDLPGGSPF